MTEAVDAVVLAALPEELRPLRAMLAEPRRTAGGGPIERGRWAGREVALALTGDGARNARAGAAAALDRLRPRAVIAIGVAGGLSPQLAPGTLLMANVVMREDGEARAAHPALLAAASRHAPARPAALISAGRLAASVADKRRLLALATARAPGLLAAVDLESASFADAAAERGLPFLILRAISDGATEPLPPLLERCVDEGGALRRGRVVARLLGQPSAFPHLLGLRRRVRACAYVLAAATAALIAGT